MKKLLVVDDENAICEFLRDFFEEREFDVRTAQSGEDALKKIEIDQPHVILLDVHMPGMNGMRVLEQVKQKYPQIKVIMVTALETREKIEEAMRLGADNYITKPLSLDYLEKEVQQKIAQLAQS